MIIRMSRPWRHPDTGVLYYRGRVPADVLPSLAGRAMGIEVADYFSTIKLVSVIKVSLRTKDAAEAKMRHSQVEAQLHRRWEAARGAAVTLSHKQVLEIAGEWYRDLVQTHEDDPGQPDQWKMMQDLLAEGLQYLDPDGDGILAPEYDPRQAERHLSNSFRLDSWLEARGLSVDRKTYLKLLCEIAAALYLAAETLHRRACGDYGPDLVKDKFPKPVPLKRPQEGASSLMALFEGWARESNPSTSTLDQWRKHVQNFISFANEDDASKITTADVVGWKEHLLALGNTAKTINSSKLAAVKAVFRWALQNGRLGADPASGITVRRGQKPGEQMRGFERDEASTILVAASKESSVVYRWVPLLCAQSGARVSEICQLLDTALDGRPHHADILMTMPACPANQRKTAIKQTRSKLLDLIRDCAEIPPDQFREGRILAARREIQIQ